MTSHVIPYIKSERVDDALYNGSQASTLNTGQSALLTQGIESQQGAHVSNEPRWDQFQLQIKPEPVFDVLNNPNIHPPPNLPTTIVKKKRGRPKKIKVKEEFNENGKKIKQEKITEHLKVRKKHDRFKGMTEEEVLKRVLPDHVKEHLDILIVGINPGLTAAFVGHHYAGPGNHMWKCLFLSGLIPEPWNAYQDEKLLDYGIGFTNIVERTSRGSADLTKKEIQEGGEILKEKMRKYRPKIAMFNGKGIYEVFVGHKNFHIGKQPDNFPDCPETSVFVMPSSSARFTQLPRAIDKVPFYVALKKYRDYLNGHLAHIDESEISFPYIDLKVKLRPETILAQQQAAKEAAEKGDVKPEKKPRVRKRVKKEVGQVQGEGHIGHGQVQGQSLPPASGGQMEFNSGQMGMQNPQMFQRGFSGDGSSTFTGIKVKQESGQGQAVSPYFSEGSSQGYWDNQSISQGNKQSGTPGSYSIHSQVKIEPGLQPSNSSTGQSVGGHPGGQQWHAPPNYMNYPTNCALSDSQSSLTTSSCMFPNQNGSMYSAASTNQFGNFSGYGHYGNNATPTTSQYLQLSQPGQAHFNMNGMYSNAGQPTSFTSNMYTESVSDAALLGDVDNLIKSVKQEHVLETVPVTNSNPTLPSL